MTTPRNEARAEALALTLCDSMPHPGGGSLLVYEDALEAATKALALLDEPVPAETHEWCGVLCALKEPAPADEREALAKVIYYWDVSENVGSKAWDQLTEGQRDTWRDAADKILAAGFRRQGPITEARKAWFEYEALAGQIDNLERSGPAALPVFFQRTRRIRDRADATRAALEAARDARSA